MEGIWTRIGQVVARRTVVVLVVVLAITGVLAAGLSRLDFATGQDSYIDKDSTEAQDNRRYQELFGGESMVVLFTVPEGGTVVDLFTDANLTRFDQLDAALHDPESGLEAVITPVTALRWTEELITSGAATRILTGAITREPDPAAATLRQDDAALTLARLAAAGEPSFTNPEWLRFLLFDNTGFSLVDGQVVAPPDSGLAIRKALLTFFPDPQHAMAIASVNGNATLDELATGSRSVKDAVAAQGFEGADVIVTGTPTFLTDINDYLQEGMLTLGLIAVAVMLIVLAIVFRVRWRLLPMLAVLVGIVWGFGLFGYLGIDLSLVTIAGLPILIGVGVEFAIQVHNRVEEECVLDRDTNPFGETARELGPPMVVATVSAVISFLVMRISRVPMIQDFGVLLSIGIVMLLVTGIVVPLAVLGARERRRPTTEVRTGVTERILHWLGSLPSAAVVPLVVIAIVIPILGLVLERNSEIESDPINWADQSTDTVKNARQLEQDVNFATTLGIFIETSGHDENGIFTDQLAAFVHDFVARELEAEESTLVQASSLVSTVSYLIEVPGTTSLPPTGADVLEAYTVAPPDIQRLLVGSDGNAAQVLFQVGPSSLEERAGLVERLETAIAQPGDDVALPGNAAATPAGLAIVGVGLLNNLTANRVALTVVALLLVAGGRGRRRWRQRRRRFGARHRDCGGDGLLLAADAVGDQEHCAGHEGDTGNCGHDPPRTQIETVRDCDCGGEPAPFVGPSRQRRHDDERTQDGHRHVQRDDRAEVPQQRQRREHQDGEATDRRERRCDERTPGALRRERGSGGRIEPGAASLHVATGQEGRELRARRDDERTPDRGQGAERDAEQCDERGRAADCEEHGDHRQRGTGQVAVAEHEPRRAATTVTLVATGDTLPPGPPEKPAGLVAGTFFDTLTGAGVDPGVARCAADTLVGTTPEADLLAMGIASSPRPDAVNELLSAAALACGVPQATLDELAAA